MNKPATVTLKILPHLCIALAVNVFTFFVIDQLNRAMVFMANDITKWLLAVMAALVFGEATVYLLLCRDDGAETKKARAKDRARTVLVFLALLFSTFLLAWFVADRIDGAARFLDVTASKWITGVYCLLTVALSVLCLIRVYRKNTDE